MSDRNEPGTWHVDQVSLRQWVDGTGGSLAGVSVEQHVIRCARCRREVAAMVEQEPLEAVLEGVLAAVNAPRPNAVERLLTRLGVSASGASVVGSAVTLRLPWIGGLMAVMLFALAASIFGHDGGVVLFLIGAPLVPVIGVGVAYGPSSDPLYELVVAAPYPMVRVVLLRTAWVLATSAPLTVATGLLLPEPSTLAVAWLLPATGFIAVVLLASVWVDPAYAAGAVAIGWVVTVALAVHAGQRSTLFAPTALLIYIGCACLAGLLLVERLRRQVPSWRLR